ALDFARAHTRRNLYGPGWMFSFLLTGRPPFPEGTSAKKLLLRQMKEPPPLVQFRTDLPPRLQPVVSRMMAKQPQDRFQTPAEAARALEELSPRAAPVALLVPAARPLPPPPPLTIHYP